MTRTLIPLWSVYKEDFHLDSEEPFETFDWLPDAEMRSYYEEARAGLDTIPGSREWLKEYTCPEDLPPFFDSMGLKIMKSFGNRHSGSSGTSLGWNYKFLLNNWAAFVKDTKTYYAKKLYKELQLQEKDLYALLDKQETVADFRARYDLPYDLPTIEKMVRELDLEHREERRLAYAKRQKENFDGRIDVLKHHYKFPERWRDTPNGSSLFGHPSMITEEMFVVMEGIYPGYRKHIKGLF